MTDMTDIRDTVAAKAAIRAVYRRRMVAPVAIRTAGVVVIPIAALLFLLSFPHLWYYPALWMLFPPLWWAMTASAVRRARAARDRALARL